MGLAKTVRVSMVPRMDVFQGGDRSYKRITMHITVHIWDTALLCFALYIVACVSRVSGFTYGVCELHDPEQCGGRTKFFCYKRSLEHVPPKFPHNVTDIDISHNKIKGIKSEDFQNLTHLETLNISYNSISYVEKGAFRDLISLTELGLSSNRLSIITKEFFQGLTNLKVLLLDKNNISTTENSSFSVFHHLECVKLSENKIKVVKDCVFQDLINLKKLYLGSNYISFLDRAFQNGPAKLEYLKLSSNSLASLKTNDFRGLKSLRTLILYDNKINSIDDGTFDKLISLKVLNLHFNKITDESLRPTVFSELSNLLELTLQNNHILKAEYFQTPPFYNLTSLKVLSVLSQRHHNNQSFLPYNFLQNLRHLHTFWAQNAGLKYLHDDVFKDNTQLAELALSGNDLTTLSLNVFLPLRKLYKLHLKETRLKTLDFLVQANLQDLYYLQISNNQISSINETIIMSLPGLRLLDMQGNTFTCDCSNAQFIKWLEKSNFTQVLAANTYECNSPPNFKETQLLNLDVSSCSENNELYYYISSTCLVLLTLIISLTYNFLHWQIVYGYYLFLAFLYDNKKKGSHKPLGFQYDAFVSYNKHDELWVTSELLPKLEGEQGWRLCLHHRDFQPGKPIVDNIVDGIYSSRKTICILSQHYLESEWCSREVQVASFRLFDEKKDVLILLFLEDIPVYRLSPYYRMRGLVKKRTYLSWPKAGQDTRVFWEKLRVALGARRGSEEENSLSDVQNVL
ncbi:toll-like receptor 13 isoform X2 [Alosa alosa]|uniref:toll-like receptor 13 isoform X2 n=1 Tax=Alosa alosa TaxID=278164 RepID=UPI0020152ECD|nr:toll-like receptor 13 isoform X2 [Alosa alosa]